MAENKLFHWIDYMVFGISLSLGVFVGIVMAIKEKWLKQSSESYLMGNRRMNWFLVSMSVLASIMTARAFVAFPAEYYYSGMVLVWLVGTYSVGGIYAAVIVIPKFFRLGFQITSAYEYFYHRFGMPVRFLVSILYFLFTLLYLSVILYIPSLVLAQVSVLNIYWSILLGGCVCFLYTAFGGIKAVIFVDSLQIIVIAIGMLALTIKGMVDIGGFDVVWHRYKDIGQRNNWDDTSAEPWDRYNIWNISFLLGMLMMGLDGADQMVLQRYMTVPDMRQSQRTILLATVGGILFFALTLVLAMVMFASVGGNEPLLLKQIARPDQIMPYFLMKTFGDYHGIPGIVVAALFAASLSSLSSGENALAAVFLEDIVRPLYKMARKKTLSEKQTNVTSKIVGVCIGIVVLALSMLVPLYTKTILQASLNIQSFLMGPLMGLFIVGLFMPWVEQWGAFTGMLVSVGWAIMLWGGAQRYSHKLGLDLPPLFLKNFTVPVIMPEPTAEPTLWDVSYTWYTFLDICVVVVISNIVSLFIRCFSLCPKKRPPKEFLYTTEDFLIAIGLKKHKPENITDPRARDDTIQNDDTKKGIDNESFDIRL